MAQATVVLASVRAHIGCVPSKTEGYVCPICLGPVHVQYPHCYSCKQLFIQGGAPEELADRIVPMSTALNPSTWYSHLSGYKGLSPSYQQPLAAMATEYIKSHNAKIEHLLGGEGSFTTVVPSTRGVSFEDQPLTKTLQLAHALRDHVRQTLAHVTGETIARGSYRPEGFVPQGEAVEGQRIVLIEDLWVSGATCVSAAGALLSAGAESVVILVLARQIRDNPNFVPAEYREAMGLQYDVTSWPRD